MSTWHGRDLLGFPAVSSSLVPIAVAQVCTSLSAFVHPALISHPTEARQGFWRAGQWTMCLHRRAAVPRGSRELGQLHSSGRLKGHSDYPASSLPRAGCSLLNSCFAQSLKSCQASGLRLPTTLCLEKFTLPYKPHVFPLFIHSQQNPFIHCKEFLPFLGVCALWIFIGCYHIHLAQPGYMYSALLIFLCNSIPPTPSSFFVVLLSNPTSSSCSFCFG